MLEIIRDSSPQKFLIEAGFLLYQEEAANGLMLGLCEMMPNAQDSVQVPPVLLRVVEGGETVSAAIQTNPPQSNLVLTFANGNQLRGLAEYLQQEGIKFPGVVGPAVVLDHFSDLWSEMSSQPKTLGMGQKIYKAVKVIPPKSCEGELRVAARNDLNLVTQWLVEFTDECLPAHERKSFDDLMPVTVKKIADKWIYLWVIDGQPVSVAHAGRPTRNGISVGGVFTPKHLRKKGYASAVVAGITQAMLDSGKQFCVLYTDLSNPTSNKIYQDVGYREVADSKYFLFV